MDPVMGRRNVVWKTPDISSDGLKNFACIVMLLQAMGMTIVENGMIHLNTYTQESLSQALAEDSHLMVLAGVGSVLQLLGGMAIPVFTFLLVEGFRNTSSYRNYLLAVTVTALISEIPYDLAVKERFFDFSSQNAMIGTVISLLMLYFLGMTKEMSRGWGLFLRIMIVLCAVVWVSLFRAQYGLCTVLLTAVFYLLYSRNVAKTIFGAIISLLYVTGPIAFYPIWCYDGTRKNRIPKYAYYAFYPLHLLVLGLIVRLGMSA